MTLVWRPGFAYDTDASAYIDAVEVADGQALETATRYAINDFVLGCKQDGIWTAIKASCILAGARTLAGALVPLVGTAPTNVGFIGIGTDYVRKTGLVGNGGSKYLNSNRTAAADPQNNQHMSVYISSATTLIDGKFYLGVRNSNTDGIGVLTDNTLFFNSRNTGPAISNASGSVNFIGHTRSLSTAISYRLNNLSASTSATSSVPDASNIFIFARNSVFSGGANNYTNARLAFYSIGESLDLALLDNRVSTLIAQFGAVIP